MEMMGSREDKRKWLKDKGKWLKDEDMTKTKINRRTRNKIKSLPKQI